MFPTLRLFIRIAWDNSNTLVRLSFLVFAINQTFFLIPGFFVKIPHIYSIVLLGLQLLLGFIGIYPKYKKMRM
jgi:hypothetical protein